MSSPDTAAAAATAAATPSAASTKRQSAPPKLGADLIAERLVNIFHSATRPTQVHSVDGLLKHAWRVLSTSFTANQGRGKSATTGRPPSMPAVTPSIRITRSVASCTSRHLPSPLRFPINEDESMPAFTADDAPLDLHNIPRLDQIYIPVSVNTRGMRRLRLHEILRLGSTEECAIFLPPFNKNDAPQWKDAHNHIMSSMRKIIMTPFIKTSTPAERDAAWIRHLSKREKQRDGSVGYEFHLRVANVPARASLLIPGLLVSEVDHLMNPITGAGITFEIIGYGAAVTSHIKFHHLPFIEVYVPVKDNDAVINPINLTKSKKDDVVLSQMVRELNETKGDVVAWSNIIISYYKNALKSGASAVKVLAQQQHMDSIDSLKQCVRQEVNDEALDSFAQCVDDLYRRRLRGAFGFGEIRSHLLTEEDFVALYSRFKTQFPLVYNTFHHIVSSKHFNDDKTMDNQEHTSLHRKQKLILFLCLATIRAKSSHKLRYFAIIEPLALFYKGHQQPSSKSLSGAFTTTIQTALNACESLLDEAYPGLAAYLESQPVQIGACDNYQSVNRCMNQVGFKSAITHRGTAYYLMKVKNIEIPPGSVVESPTGIRFKVMQSKCHAPAPDFWHIIGEILGDLPRNDSVPDGLISSEVKLIRSGVLLPKLGWTVIDMPGFVDRPPIVFRQQIIPPPRRAWVHKDATAAQIVFGKDRMFTKPTDPNAVSFSTINMVEAHDLARRIIDLGFHARHLKHRRAKRSEAAGVNVDFDSIYEREFVNAMESVSMEFDQACAFETDLVQHYNPNSKVVSQLLPFPLSPHCETTHEGMKMVFVDMAQSFRFVEVNENGKVQSHPDAAKRKCHLCVDALTSRNFRQLRFNFIKKLSELNSSEYVEPLIEVLNQFTCQHDYLHEIRMHRSDVIFCQFYGSVLQPFQVEIRMQRVNGDPVKSGLQAHERLLEIVYKALKERFNDCFLRYVGNGGFIRHLAGYVGDMSCDMSCVRHNPLHLAVSLKCRRHLCTCDLGSQLSHVSSGFKNNLRNCKR